jgi:hypothetical protein
VKKVMCWFRPWVAIVVSRNCDAGGKSGLVKLDCVRMGKGGLFTLGNGLSPRIIGAPRVWEHSSFGIALLCFMP